MASAVAAQPLDQPLRPDPAREALAARLLGEELHGLARHADHVAGVVEDHDAAGAQEGALRADGGLVQGHVQVLARQKAARKPRHRVPPARCARDGGPPAQSCSSSRKREPQRDLVVAGPRDVARQADHLGARVAAAPESPVPVRPVQQNRGRRGQRLDVVHDGGQVLVAVRDGEGGTVAGEGMPALQRVQQRRLLAADVGAGAAPDHQPEGEVRPQDPVAQQPRRLRLGDRAFENPERLGVLVAQIDEPALRTGRVRRQRHPLDHPVGIVVHEHPVLEAAGLALVGVAHDRLWSARRVRHRPPLPPGGEAGPAPARQPARVDRVDHFARGHPAGRPLQRLVAALAAVPLQRGPPGPPDSREHALLDAFRGRRRQRRRRARQGARGRPGQDGVAVDHRHRLIAAPGTRHGVGVVSGGAQAGRQHVGAPHAAHRAVADPGPAEPAGVPREVVVEGDRAEEVGDGDPEPGRDRPQRLLREMAVALVQRVEEGEEGGGLVLPAPDEFVVGRRGHPVRGAGVGVGAGPLRPGGHKHMLFFSGAPEWVARGQP